MIGVGIDAVDVPRFRASLTRRPSLASRLFTDAELAYANSKRDPAEPLAVRFAAKEAVMKALGVGLGAFDFHDVEVVLASTGRPFLNIQGRADRLAAAAGVSHWHLSLTHTATVAQAVVVAE